MTNKPIERRVRGAEDDDIDDGKIEIATYKGTTTTVTEHSDPFQKTFKKANFSGISDTFRRKVNRQLQKVYKGTDGTQTKQIEEDSNGYNLFDVMIPPYNPEYLAALTEKSAFHHAAIKAKESNIVGLGFSLVESPKTKRKLSETTDEQQAARLRNRLSRLSENINEYIDSCNDHDSLVDILSKVWYDYEAIGHGFIEIGRTSTGMIGYIGHIPATTMRVRRQRDGYVQIIADKVTYFRNFGENNPNPIGKDPNPNEIIMIKKYHPTNMYYGVPDIISASNAVAGNEFAARFNIDYFENKAVPRHVIVLKGAEFSKASERKLTEFFETGLKGPSNNHRSIFVPLPADRQDKKVDLKIEAVEAGVQDQSFERYKKSNISEILTAHRVPPNKVGLLEGGSIAAALDASKTFKEQVCQPEQRMLAKKMNKILREWTDALVFQFNELTLTDEDTRSKINERLLRMQVLTPNEVRNQLGYPARQDGDEVIILNAQRAAEQRANANASRQEDSDRSAETSTTQSEGQNPAGEGRRRE